MLLTLHHNTLYCKVLSLLPLTIWSSLVNGLHILPTLLHMIKLAMLCPYDISFDGVIPNNPKQVQSRGWWSGWGNVQYCQYTLTNKSLPMRGHTCYSIDDDSGTKQPVIVSVHLRCFIDWMCCPLICMLWSTASISWECRHRCTQFQRYTESCKPSQALNNIMHILLRGRPTSCPRLKSAHDAWLGSLVGFTTTLCKCHNQNTSGTCITLLRWNWLLLLTACHCLGWRYSKVDN